MLKIFVTGDNHIGKIYAGNPARKEIIKERTEAFSRMVDKANSEKCDLFVITGDMFDDTNVDSKQVKAVVDILSGFTTGIVAVLPGNHDCYNDSAEVWKTFADAIETRDRIVLLTEEDPEVYDYGKFVLYPAVCRKENSDANQNALGWIKKLDIPNDGKYRIGIAHGNIAGEAPDDEGVYFPMSREELNGISNIDVWLLGHVHVPFPKNLSEEFEPTGQKIFNPGSHVQVHVKNNTEGLCFILELDENKNIRAKKFVSGGLRFYRDEIDVVSGKLADTLKHSLSGYGDRSIVELIIKGAVSDEEYDSREEIIKKALERFLWSKFNANQLFRLITKKDIERFPETSLYAKMLNELLTEPMQASMAFDLLTNPPSPEDKKKKKESKK